MKTIIAPLFALLVSSIVSAQDFSKVCKEQMNALASFSGQWKGDATLTQQGGPPIQLIQEETIDFKLDSLVLQFEGIGRKKTEPSKISFHALAYVNYNAMKKEYEMKSFLLDGRQADAYFKVIEKNTYDWGFDVPGGKIVYHITLDPIAKKWHEKGEFSRDGNQWYPFFEMNLIKQP